MKIRSESAKTSIAGFTAKQRSLLFAELSAIAYMEPAAAKPLAKKLGFTQTEFYSVDGAQAYRFQNTRDCVIVCRGTEPTCFNDIAADLKAYPVPSDSKGRVHRGFKKETDDLWPKVKEDLPNLKKQQLWFAGHSLGAAMATIMASRCWYDHSLSDPEELYTYGSPRVGWRAFVDTLAVKHHRWVNNNDIVTRVPLWLMGYRHDGETHYINAFGNVRELTGWQRTKDRFRGLWLGLLQGSVDSFADHSIGDYVEHIYQHSKDCYNKQSENCL